MRRVSVFILDRRYTVPTLRFDLPVMPGGETELARRILEEDSAHLVVEVRDGEELVARVERPSTAPQAAPRTARSEGQPLER